MPIKVQCNSCGKVYQIADALAGKKVKCKNCGAIFPIPAAEDEFGEIDLAKGDAAGSKAGAARTGKPPLGTPVARAGDEDDPFRRAAEEAGGQPVPAVQPTLVFNPAFRFPGNRGLESLLPPLLAIALLGWLVIQSLLGEDPNHGWVAPVRALLYLLACGGIVYPAALMGLRKASDSAQFGMPPRHQFKALGIAAAPAALGAIFALISGSVGSMVVGVLLGLVVALAAFVFLYRLRSQQIGPASGILAGYLVAGVTLAAGVLVGVNVLILALLTVGKTAHTYAQSPLGPAFSWHPQIPPPDNSRIRPHGGNPEVSTDSSDNNATTEPGPTTRPSATAPSNPLVSTTQPDKSREHMATTVAIGPDLTTRPTEATTVAVVPGTQPAMHPALPSLLAGAPDESSIAECEDVAFPSGGGAALLLNIHTRGAIADELELWTVNPPKRRLAVNSLHKSEEKDAYFLGPKGMVARIAEFPKPTLEVRSLDERANAPPKRIELDVLRNGTPKLLGFLPNGQITVFWDHAAEFAIEVVDPQTNQHLRGINLMGYTPGRANLAISPDGRFLAAFVHAGISGPAIQIGDLTGARFQKVIPVESVPVGKSVGLAGLSFSPNGQKLALLYQEGGNGIISTYKIPEGTAIGSNIFFKGPAAESVADFRGSSLDWLADNAALLVNGRAIIDAANFNVLGDLGMSDVKEQHVFDRDTIALTVQPTDAKPHVALVKLNLEKLTSLEATKAVARPTSRGKSIE